MTSKATMALVAYEHAERHADWLRRADAYADYSSLITNAIKRSTAMDHLIAGARSWQTTLDAADGLSKALSNARGHVVGHEALSKMARDYTELCSAISGAVGNTNIERLINGGLPNSEIMRMSEVASSITGRINAGADFGLKAKLAAGAIAGFRLPQLDEVVGLLSGLADSESLASIRGLTCSAEQIQRAIGAMKAPWLDVNNAIGSIKGFAELQNVGLAVQTMPAFGGALTNRLRDDFGDLRRAIEWPEKIFRDAFARSSYYEELGFNPRLTNFPVAAFHEGVALAGLGPRDLPTLETGDAETEEGFRRNNDAHDILQRFEMRLRRFIDQAMTRAFGANWIKHKVPGQIRANWQDKKNKARENGEPERPLIYYSDFTDYVPVITRRDNWNEVFEPVFRRPEAVRESFQRLYPIRICTMHARLITQDDELYLYVETKRILRAIAPG